MATQWLPGFVFALAASAAFDLTARVATAEDFSPPRSRRIANPRDFGAAGDGITDDRPAIQAAIDSLGGPGTVRFPPGTYRVTRAAGHKLLHGGSTVTHFCIDVPSGTQIDLGGATLKLADGANAALLVNRSAPHQDQDIGIFNGYLDGNRTNQSALYTGNTPCIYLYNVLRPRVEDIVVTDARDFAGRFLSISDGLFRRLSVSRSDGDGWSFGTTPGNEVSRSTIDQIYAESCRATVGDHQGNGAIFTVLRSHIGRVETRDCSGGIKIQNTSADSRFEELIFSGPLNGTLNSGVKVQGAGPGLRPTRIHIEKVVSVDAYDAGLFVYDAEDISIGSYSGLRSGARSGSDVHLKGPLAGSPTGVHIGRITSEGSRAYGVLLSGHLVYHIGSVHVSHCASRALQISTTGSLGNIDSIEAIDTRIAPLLTEALAVTDADAKGTCQLVRTNLPHTRDNHRVAIVPGARLYRVNAVLAGNDPATGVVVLGPTTSAHVANSNISRRFVGRDNAYLEPLISLTPLSLEPTCLGPIDVTVDPHTVSNGFTLRKRTEGSRCSYYWKIEGWLVRPERRPGN